MTIDRHNIEAYLLDYYEGRLDPVLSAELMAFLAENPAYEMLLPEEAGPFLSATASLGNSGMLKKDYPYIPEIHHANFEEFCIAASEGLLAPADIRRLEVWLEQHPEQRSVYDLYARLKLHPDPALVFHGKSSLKKGHGRTILLRSAWTLLGIAASVVVILLLNRPSPAPEPAISTAVSLPPTDAPAPEAAVNQALTVPVIHQTSPAITETIAVPVEIPEPSVSLEPLTPITGREARIRAAGPSPRPVRPLKGESPDDGLLLASSPRTDRESLLPSMVSSLFRKVDLWKAAESAVSGFNYLTESQVAISRTMDDSGRPVALGLDTEQYMIRGNKVK